MQRHNDCCRVATIVNCTSGKLVIATEVVLPVVAIMQRAQLPPGSTQGKYTPSHCMERRCLLPTLQDTSLYTT
jgi:hypothetical protein